jgi:hypothetical protein
MLQLGHQAVTLGSFQASRGSFPDASLPLTPANQERSGYCGQRNRHQDGSVPDHIVGGAEHHDGQNRQ